MAKSPKARGKNGQATLNELVAKALEWSEQGSERTLWLAALLHNAGHSELSVALAGPLDALVASAAAVPQDPYQDKTSSFRALAALGEVDKAQALLDALAQTRDPSDCLVERGIVVGALAAAGRTEAVLESLRSVEVSDLGWLISAGVAGLATLSVAPLCEVISLLEASSREQAAFELIAAIDTPKVQGVAQLLAFVDAPPVDRAFVLQQAGLLDAARAALPEEPDEAATLRWCLLHYELGLSGLDQAAQTMDTLFPTTSGVTLLVAPLLQLLSSAADRGDLDEADLVVQRVEQAWKRKRKLSKLDLGRFQDLKKLQLAVQARLLQGDAKARTALLKQARTAASPQALNTVLSQELSMDAPLEAFRTAKKLKAGPGRAKHAAAIAVAYLPDLAGGLLAIEALAERPAARLEATRVLAQACLALGH